MANEETKNKLIRPVSNGNIWSVEMDNKTIAILCTKDDADKFIEFYKNYGRPSDDAKFTKTERALISME